MPPSDAAQCIFCQIAAGAVPARKVFEDELVLAVLDINPASLGHVLLIPKEHVTVLPQAPDETAERLGSTARLLGTAALAFFRQRGCQGTTFLAANGPAAGQRAGHAILHIIPRFPNDGVGLAVPAGQAPQERQELHEMLARASAKAHGYPEDEYLKGSKPAAAGAVPPEKPPQKPAAGNELDDITAFLAGRK
jgi:histidine triad (HIT) family protein